MAQANGSPATTDPHQNGEASQGQQSKGEATAEEPAPDDARYSNSYIYTCLIGYSLSFVIFGSQVSILGPTIQPLAERLSVAEADLSPLFTALGISCIVSGTPSGWLVDRVPTHHVLIGSLLVEAAGFALVPVMPSVWSLTALYFIICFSYNFTNSAVFTSLGWMFPKRAGSALNLVLAMFGVGSFFIPLAAQACKHLLGSALAVFWVVAAVSLIASVPFFFVSSPKPPAPDLSSVGPSPFIKNKRIAMLETAVITAIVVLVFFTTAAETAVGNWVYTYTVREAKLSDSDAALANSVFWGSFTIGRVFGAAISHLTTPSVLLLSFTPLAVLGASLPTWATHLLTPWWLVVATAALSGLGNSTGYANAVSLLERYVPVSGFINGLFGMVAGGACMVGPTAVAVLAKYTSLQYTAMAWVGTLFYLLHFPAIFTALGVGSHLSAQYSSPFDEEGGLADPLLGPPVHGVSPTHANMHRQGSLGRSIRHSIDGKPILVRRASIPGHASPIAGSMG